MNKIGIQYLNKDDKRFIEEGLKLNESSIDCVEVKEVLRKFEAGYIERNLRKVDSFIEELFINSEDTYILGTGTGELCLGIEGIREVISGDWEFWGDVRLDWENANINTNGEVAWFNTAGTLKQTFEHTPERYDRYVNFIKEKAEDVDFTAKEKVTFINWILTLNYHNREGQKREYLWPLGLSGVLLKENNQWKIAHLQFSIARANVPDERFESSKKFLEHYNEQTAKALDYKNNKISSGIKELLKGFEEDLFGKTDISIESLCKYFKDSKVPCIMAQENQRYFGIEQARQFFIENSESTLSLDLDHAIASASGDTTWFTVTGMLKQELSEEDLAKRALEEMQNIFESELSSQEKLFAAHRSTAYALKDSAANSSEHTYPIRFTGVMTKGKEGLRINSLHCSFPFYWMFEGKLEGTLISIE